jgi:hypothetical protein
MALGRIPPDGAYGVRNRKTLASPASGMRPTVSMDGHDRRHRAVGLLQPDRVADASGLAGADPLPLDVLFGGLCAFSRSHGVVCLPAQVVVRQAACSPGPLIRLKCGRRGLRLRTAHWWPFEADSCSDTCPAWRRTDAVLSKHHPKPMATTNLMIQLFTEQIYDSTVTEVYPIDDEAYLFLDPTQDTVIREIATEEWGGMLASGFPSALTIGFTNKAFATVTLISASDGTETVFYAPSHVSSPPVAGAGLAVLKVSEVGISVESHATVSLARAIGSHVYVDQVD